LVIENDDLKNEIINVKSKLELTINEIKCKEKQYLEDLAKTAYVDYD
jgi:hypothetical protein